MRSYYSNVKCINIASERRKECCDFPTCLISTGNFWLSVRSLNGKRAVTGELYSNILIFICKFNFVIG